MSTIEVPFEQKTSTEKTTPVLEPERYTLESITKIIGLIVLGLIGCVGLFGIYVMLDEIRNPKTLYFKTSETQQLVQDVPLDKQNLPINILLNWVAQSMMSAHTFNFINYPKALENARQYFTKDGYESYMNTLKESKILEAVVNGKFVLNSVPDSTPQITKEGVLANYFLWKIRVPMTFHYRNVTMDVWDTVLLTLLIVRVPTTEAPYGIRILKYELFIQPRGESLKNL